MESPATAWFRSSAAHVAFHGTLSQAAFDEATRLLAADSRAWPSGLPESLCVVVARAAVEELMRACETSSPWTAMDLCHLGRDLLTAGPYGLGTDTARILLASATLPAPQQSARAKAVAGRIPGGPGWAMAALDRAEQVTLARDGWHRADFAEAVDALGLDVGRIPLGWFGQGADRMDTCEMLGLFDALPEVHAHACLSLVAEWDEWDTFGSFVRSASLLVR